MLLREGGVSQLAVFIDYYFFLLPSLFFPLKFDPLISFSYLCIKKLK